MNRRLAAVLIGAVTTVVGVLASGWLVGLFGVGAEVEGLATEYLALSFLGTVPLLLVLAVTGVLRGLQDTRTPLVVAVAGNLANLGLNVLLVHGVGWGVAGSAIGTVVGGTSGAAPVGWKYGARRRKYRTPALVS